MQNPIDNLPMTEAAQQVLKEATEGMVEKKEVCHVCNIPNRRIHKYDGVGPVCNHCVGITHPPRKSPLVYKNKKVHRNDPCYCGSGLKFKKCHGQAHVLDREPTPR